MDDTRFQAILIKRLNILISLMLDVASKDTSISTTEKIQRLFDIGLQPAEIAEIMGKETNYITAVIHRTKKKEKKKG